MSRSTAKGRGAPGAHPDGDKSLWEQVKRTVDPLHADQRARYAEALQAVLDGNANGHTPPSQAAPKRQNPARGALAPHAPRHPEAHRSGGAAAPAAQQAKRSAPQTPPLVALDRKTRGRIARGRTPIDARIDLHGLRQHEAHDVLRSFIFRSQAQGFRTVLVITGKGTRARDPHPEAPPWAVGAGILKKAVPGWLQAPDLRGAVLSVEAAHASHGGEGALYVRLRSARKAGS